MKDLNRRDAMKSAAATGIAAAAVAGVAGLSASAHAGTAQDKHPNEGTPATEAAPRSAAALLTGTYLTAVVDATGALQRGRFVLSAQKLSTGQYEVIFLYNVRAGTYVASIGLPGSVGASAPGEISVVGRFSDVRGVYIETKDSSGQATDLGFHLAVMLP